MATASTLNRENTFALDKLMAFRRPTARARCCLTPKRRGALSSLTETGVALSARLDWPPTPRLLTDVTSESIQIAGNPLMPAL